MAKPVTSHVGSITDPEVVCRAVQGADCVMHVAGVVSFGSTLDLDLMNKVNVEGQDC